MGVFAATTKVKRAVADPGTDDTLPGSGSLSWGGITSASAVAGTAGVDAKLVHGDRWQQISGSMSEFVSANVLTNILQNQTLNVTGNRTQQVTGNHTETVVGIRNDTTIGAHTEVNVSPRNNTYVSPKIELHSSPRCVDEVGLFMKHIENELKSYSVNMSHSIQKIDIAGISTALFAQKLDVGGVVGKVVIADAGTRQYKNDIALFWNRIRTLDAKSIALIVHLGITEPGTAFKPNAMPTPTIVTPFD